MPWGLPVERRWPIVPVFPPVRPQCSPQATDSKNRNCAEVWLRYVTTISVRSVYIKIFNYRDNTIQKKHTTKHKVNYGLFFIIIWFVKSSVKTRFIFLRGERILLLWLIFQLEPKGLLGMSNVKSIGCMIFKNLKSETLDLKLV